MGLLIPAALRALRHYASTAPSAAEVECVVIGAGVVGLACARALALAGKEVMVLEAESSWGTQTSARHSEVIHAGLYYAPGTLKAKFCVQGKRMLYDYLKHHGVSHRRVTKLLVATDDKQVDQLRAIQAHAVANGVLDLEWLTGRQAQQLEPQLHAVAALLSPSTGIFDSHGYMSALLADAENAGASLAVASKVTGGRVEGPGQGPATASVPAGFGQASPTAASAAAGAGGAGPAGMRAYACAPAAAGSRSAVVLQVQDTQSGEVMELRARHVVNAAGLWAQAVSHTIQGLPAASIPKQYLARGVYFSLDNAAAASAHAHHTSSDGVAGRDSSDPGALPGANAMQPHKHAEEQPQHQAVPDPRTAAFTPQGVGAVPAAHALAAEDDEAVVERARQLPGTSPFPACKTRPFSRLIYPMPQDGGIGVHLTLDMSGHARFGPDVEWIHSVDYKVDPGRSKDFYAAIRSYWPALPDNALVPGYAGVRPKLCGPGQPAADFMLQGAGGPQGHGVPGLVCLYGIESPGLTSSLAIAEQVRDMVLTGLPRPV